MAVLMIMSCFDDHEHVFMRIEGIESCVFYIKLQRITQS